MVKTFPDGHFYSPIPDTDSILSSKFKDQFDGALLINNSQLEVDAKAVFSFSSELTSLVDSNSTRFEWNNDQFPPADAFAYYGMLRQLKPKKILEIGSGFSTQVAIEAVKKNEVGTITCIEPYPRDLLKENTQITLIESILQDVGDDIFSSLDAGDILFIDEIHRLNKISEEVLYSAMEEYRVSWVIEQGLKARSVNLGIQPFTLIGATTKFGMLSAPLRDRFGSVFRLNFYSDSEMADILYRSIKILKINSDNVGIKEIAIRSRKTPRIANRLLRRVRDFSEVQSNGNINANIVKKALDQLEVDNLGLDKIDVELLESLVKKFDGGPVGLQTLAASISEDPNTVEDVIEPFLLNLGFISRTNRGRVATKLAYKHLGIDIRDEPAQGTLLN